MKSAITILKEQLNNLYLIFKLAFVDVKSANKNHYLGMLWEVISPAILIMIYWLVFGVGIRHRADVEVGGDIVPFIYWLMTGYMVWMFFSKSASSGAKAIFSKLRVVSKMNFPMSILPNYTIFSKFMVHVVMVGIIIVILQFAGYPINIYYLQMPYFMIANYFFTFLFVLIFLFFFILVCVIFIFFTFMMCIFMFLFHVFMVYIIIVILQFAGYPINIYYLQMPYFMIATYFFTFSFVLIFSTLSTLVRDIYKLLTSTMRIGIYISPILWDVTEVKDDGTVATAVITAIVKLNPLTYLQEGYRASYFGVEWYFITESGTTLYFWTLTLILFVIGSVLHMHFRKYFIDFL